MRKVTLAIAGALAGLVFGASASAQDFGALPISYEDMTVSYLKSRMDNPRGARVSFQSDPYPVLVDIGRHQDVPGWAIDVGVHSSMGGGRRGTHEYTVLFINGRPVAIDEDDVDFIDA